MPRGPKANAAYCISVNRQVLVPFSYRQSKEKHMKILYIYIYICLNNSYYALYARIASKKYTWIFQRALSCFSQETAPSGARSSTQTRWDFAGNIFTVNQYDNILYIYICMYDYIYILFTQFVFLTPIKRMFFLQMVHWSDSFEHKNIRLVEGSRSFMMRIWPVHKDWQTPTAKPILADRNWE